MQTIDLRWRLSTAIEPNKHSLGSKVFGSLQDGTSTNDRVVMELEVLRNKVDLLSQELHRRDSLIYGNESSKGLMVLTHEQQKEIDTLKSLVSENHQSLQSQKQTSHNKTVAYITVLLTIASICVPAFIQHYLKLVKAVDKLEEQVTFIRKNNKYYEQPQPRSD